MAKAKLSITIVGAGNLARVLAICLHRAGYRIAEVVARDEPASQKRAANIARRVQARAASYETASLEADILWICVTDDAVPAVARKLVAQRKNWRRKTVFHSSGALPSTVLDPLRKAGATTASIHPMNTFVVSTDPRLQNTPFSVEGMPDGAREGEKIARALTGPDGYVFRIEPKDKVLYHAMGSFASPLLVSLLAVAEAVGRAAGIKQPQLVMHRILQRTIENYLAKGAGAAFSGPINRGDLATIRKHLRALQRVGDAAEIYRLLATNAARNLPVRDSRGIRKLLRIT